MAQYGLIVMNVQYGASQRQPMRATLVDSIVSYVKNGGSLLVVSRNLDLGREQYYNQLISRFGITFDESAPRVHPDDERAPRLVAHPAVSGLNGFRAELAIPLRVRRGTAIAHCGSKPVMAVATVGSGRVVVAGVGRSFMGAVVGGTSADKEDVARNKSLLAKLAVYLLGD